MPVHKAIEADCQAIYAFRCRNAGRVPCHCKTDPECNRLGIKKNKLKARCSKPLSAKPSDRKLSLEENRKFEFCLSCLIIESGVLPHEPPVDADNDAGPAVPAAMPLFTATSNSSSLGGRVFVKAAHAQFTTATASGEKFFECSTRVSMFKKLRPGDLLCLVQTKSKGQVAAVGEVQHLPVSRENRCNVLYDRLPAVWHCDLDSYLGRAIAFDYVMFKKVYDLRNLDIKIEELLAHGDLKLNPRHNLGMGILVTEQSMTDSAKGLYDFLSSTVMHTP